MKNEFNDTAKSLHRQLFYKCNEYSTIAAVVNGTYAHGIMIKGNETPQSLKKKMGDEFTALAAKIIAAPFDDNSIMKPIYDGLKTLSADDLKNADKIVDVMDKDLRKYSGGFII